MSDEGGTHPASSVAARLRAVCHGAPQGWLARLFGTTVAGVREGKRWAGRFLPATTRRTPQRPARGVDSPLLFMTQRPGSRNPRGGG